MNRNRILLHVFAILLAVSLTNCLTVNVTVNFPEAELRKNGNAVHRLCIANKNVPKMVGQITTVLANENINIADMLNRHHDEIAYNIIDVDEEVSDAQLEKIRAIEGVIRVRLIKP